MSNPQLQTRSIAFYTTGILYIFVFAILVVYAVVRVNNLSRAVQRVKSTADTTAYMRISNEPIGSRDFLAASRPLFFPLVLKLFAQNEATVAWVQGIFSIISWAILAIALAASLKTKLLKLITVGLVLALSLHQHIMGWDSVMLTESLSLSLMALFLASWLWLLQGWRWYKVTLLLVIALAWSLCRDTNGWVLLMIAAVLLLFIIPNRLDRKFLLISIAFGLMFLLSSLTADMGGRWIYPFQNVLGRRLLSDPQAVAFLQNCGMPVSPALMSMAGNYADGKDRAFYNNPELANYRAWLQVHGKSCYTRWLLSNPVRSLRQPLPEFNALVGIQNLQEFLFSRRFSPLLPARIEALLTLRQQALLAFVLATVGAAIVLFSRIWMKNNTWWIPILLIALIYPHYFIVWHGDVQGIERHAVAVGIQLYLGLWMMLLLTLDDIVDYVGKRFGIRNKTLTWNANS